MAFVKILDENYFTKKKRALKRYFGGSYNYLTFEVFPKLRKEHKIDGLYEVELPTSELFKRVYGKMLLKFSVKNDVAIIEDLVPTDILIACFEKNLPVYKGIPYDGEKDLKKIKIMEKLL